MRNDQYCIEGLLEDMNALYEQLGIRALPQLRKLLASRPGDIMDDKNLNALLKKQKENPSFDIGSRLLSTYCHQANNENIKIHPILQNWVLSGLKRIASGEESKNVFGLKRKKGRNQDSSSISNLQIVAAYEYEVRKGLKPEKAKRAVSNKIGVTSATIDRARKLLTIGEHIKTGLLAELSQFDYSDLLGQGH